MKEINDYISQAAKIYGQGKEELRKQLGLTSDAPAIFNLAFLLYTLDKKGISPIQQEDQTNGLEASVQGAQNHMPLISVGVEWNIKHDTSYVQGINEILKRIHYTPQPVYLSECKRVPFFGILEMNDEEIKNYKTDYLTFFYDVDSNNVLRADLCFNDSEFHFEWIQTIPNFKQNQEYLNFDYLPVNMKPSE